MTCESVSSDMEVLARRAVACPLWRWMPGMRWVTPDDDAGRCDDWQPEGMARPAGALPDLSDPATVGCLLALVRQAWNEPRLHVRPEGSCWRMWATEPGAMLLPTEAAALVAALEAAP